MPLPPLLNVAEAFASILMFVAVFVSCYPIERVVHLQKSFIGKKALERQLEEGVPRRFVQILVDRHDPNSDPWPQGGEPIYRDDKCVGLSTSAVYGFTLACQVRFVC